MIQAVSKTFFHALAGSSSLKRFASSYGLRTGQSFARRFIAGETLEEAIAAARAVERAGMTVTLDLLGESVATSTAADAATREYLSVMEKMVAAGVSRNISLKLTQLGLTIDRATAVDNLRRTLDVGAKHDFFVRIDMENSPYTQVTIDIFETIWQQGYRNVGTVLQSALTRSVDDVKRMNELGATVRLVKGAYKEPRSVAYPDKAQVDEAFVAIARILLTNGTYPAIATHDSAMIAAVREFAAQQRITPDRFEFQMLYGIRRDLQSRLAAEGFRVRVYVPFGREWFPYFMRRLGERPANVGFVIRGILSERQEA